MATFAASGVALIGLLNVGECKPNNAQKMDLAILQGDFSREIKH
jgi:hypothetical protein